MSAVARRFAPTFETITGLALHAHAQLGARRERAALVAVSGIDGSGKSHLAAQLADELNALGRRAAFIGIDPWQNPQTVRFGGVDRGLHFYEHCIRFDDLFTQLIDPLVAMRSITLATRGIRTDRDVWDELVYEFDRVDTVVVEGIFLFKRTYVARYDLRIWIQCSFETALRRALRRNVEQLPEAQLRRDYDEIYYAAQRHHLRIDDPRASADAIFSNEVDR